MQEQSTTQEEWRPVVGYEGRYEVSNLGAVRSLLSKDGPRVLRQCTITDKKRRFTNYRQITLYKNGRGRSRNVHVLVLEAFVGDRPCGYDCAHADGNGENNTLQNLRWATHRENEEDKRRHGRLTTGKNNGAHTRPEMVRRGEQHGAARLTWENVVRIRNDYDAGLFTQPQLASKYNVCLATIWKVLHNETWRAP